MAEIVEGKKAPLFSAPGSDGNTYKLSDLLGEKGLILYFYPRDSTPGCTTEACDFRDNAVEIKKMGYNIVGISRDNLKSHQKFVEKQSLNFLLLSDDSGDICERYGVWQEKQFMGKKSMGIVRSTFILDETAKIKKIFTNVKVKGHIPAIIEELKSIKMEKKQ